MLILFINKVCFTYTAFLNEFLLSVKRLFQQKSIENAAINLIEIKQVLYTI